MPKQSHEAPTVPWPAGWLELGRGGFLRPHGSELLDLEWPWAASGLRNMAPVAPWQSIWLGMVQALAKIVQGALWWTSRLSRALGQSSNHAIEV